jgi:hypothetical protein
MTESDIIRKIAALKRLAERAGSPEEAAAAAAKVQELMFTYEISEALVEEAGQPASPYVNHEGVKVNSSWRATLLSAAATASFVRIIRVGSVRRLVGRTDRVQGALDLYTYLADTVDSLSKAAYREYILEFRATAWPDSVPETPNHWGHAFRCGAADTILRRMRAQRAEDEAKARQQANASQALIVIDAGLAKAVAEFYPNLTKGTQRSAINGSGYSAGMAAGQRVGLSRAPGVTAGSRRLS